MHCALFSKVTSMAARELFIYMFLLQRVHICRRCYLSAWFDWTKIGCQVKSFTLSTTDMFPFLSSLSFWT